METEGESSVGQCRTQAGGDGGTTRCGKGGPYLSPWEGATSPLSYDDVTHYGKIVVALKETIRLMEEIDEIIPSWPID